jgi:hypothetical protein
MTSIELYTALIVFWLAAAPWVYLIRYLGKR